MNDAYDGKLMECLETINAVMIRASSLKARGKLRNFTPYVPQIQNKTRWTGYQTMAEKYMKIHEPLFKTGDYTGLSRDDDCCDIEGNLKNGSKKVLPNLLMGQRFKKFQQDMMPGLSKLKRWFANIQLPELDMLSAFQLFDTVRTTRELAGQSDEFEDRLRPDHHLVVAPCFESGVRKIMMKETELMTEDEREACECLLKENWPNLYAHEETRRRSTSASASESSPSKFLHGLKQQKRSHDQAVLESNYIGDVSWICPTTVVVEQLFSKCGNILTEKRRSTNPRLFEAIVYLKQNREWWDINLVKQMKAGVFDNDLEELYRTYEDNMDEEMDEDDGSEAESDEE